MNQIIIFILGVIIGGGVVWFAIKMSERKKKPFDDTQGKESFIEKQAREKTANKEAILELLKTREKLTNDHIEMMLGIPESTVTRYMDELEEENKVKQVGDIGSGVFYEKV